MSEFVVSHATTSKGCEWWAGFENCEPFAVSEVSAEDAKARAHAFMREHGWRPEMGAEIAGLLIANYDRGRWMQGGIGVQTPDYKRPVVYTMRSGTNKNLLIANLEGVWVTKVKLPDGEMKNDGEIALLEYTCKADDVNFI